VSVLSGAAGRIDDEGRSPGWRHLPGGALGRAPDLLAERSLPAAWARLWAASPDRPVLYDPQAGWCSTGELEEASRVVAARLHAAGLRAGDRVLVAAQPSVAFVVAHVAALRLGLVVVPANPDSPLPELSHVVVDAAPRAAIVGDEELRRLLEAASPHPLLVVGPDVELPNGPAPPLDLPGPSDPALVCYTSGTTGAPKGVLLTHGNLLAGAEALRLAWRWTAEDRLVLSLPLYHLHGLAVGLHGTLLAGASAVLLPRFSPEAVADAAVAHDATLFFGVPTMYARLARSPRLDELSRLRLAVSGSAPLPADLNLAVAARIGQVVLERYGMTETLMNASNPCEGERRPGTVGFALPGVELRLDEEAHGEILVRGPSVSPCYLGRPEATAASRTKDGWFRTGDLGSLDAEGYLRIEGRSRDLVITGGHNVSPREVEEVLRRHPAVLDAAVGGVPDEEWGEVVVAWVVAEGRLDPEELRAHAAASLSRYKVPREVRLVGEIPRNALGKVQLEQLRSGG
jgi:malonyl-CoA/methylmalonyl-CoA synthetase